VSNFTILKVSSGIKGGGKKAGKGAVREENKDVGERHIMRNVRE